LRLAVEMGVPPERSVRRTDQTDVDAVLTQPSNNGIIYRFFPGCQNPHLRPASRLSAGQSNEHRHRAAALHIEAGNNV
jgi:hypothetical protein